MITMSLSSSWLWKWKREQEVCSNLYKLTNLSVTKSISTDKFAKYQQIQKHSCLQAARFMAFVHDLEIYGTGRCFKKYRTYNIMLLVV